MNSPPPSSSHAQSWIDCSNATESGLGPFDHISLERKIGSQCIDCAGSKSTPVLIPPRVGKRLLRVELRGRLGDSLSVADLWRAKDKSGRETGLKHRVSRRRKQDKTGTVEVPGLGP